MVNFFKSLGTVAEDRLKSPIVGAVALVFCANQWQILPLIILSYKFESPKIFLEEIHRTFQPMNIWAFSGEVGLILILAPLLSVCIDLLKSVFDLWYKNGSNKILGYELLTVEKSREHRRKLLEREIELDKLVEGKEGEIEALRSLLADTKGKKEESESKNLELEEGLASMAAAKSKANEGTLYAQKHITQIYKTLSENVKVRNGELIMDDKQLIDILVLFHAYFGGKYAYIEGSEEHTEAAKAYSVFRESYAIIYQQTNFQLPKQIAVKVNEDLPFRSALLRWRESEHFGTIQLSELGSNVHSNQAQSLGLIKKIPSSFTFGTEGLRYSFTPLANEVPKLL